MTCLVMDLPLIIIHFINFIKFVLIYSFITGTLQYRIIIIIIIIRRSGINPIPPMVKDRDYKKTNAKENNK